MLNSAARTPNRRVGLSLLMLFVGLVSILAGLTPASANQDSEQVSIWQVEVDNVADVDALVAGGYDLVEGRGENYLLVVGEDSVAVDLRRQGFRVTRDRQLPQLPGVARQADGQRIDAQALTYYGGYRTVDEHYAHLDAVGATYPSLATVYDYGDSWRKANGQAGANELMVICLTNKQVGDCGLSPNSAKPRAVIQAAIHARELQTSEIAWRLIDELTQQYGNDPDVTHLMDTTEIWVVPVVNPDGREIVESGGNSPYLQRKNANDSLGNCAVPPSSSNQHGVDLNRNATYGWGGIGTSTNPCAQTYRGASAASEPEQQALETLFSQLWPDQKGAASSPAPASAVGTFITLHSYGNLILLPPGAGGLSPNDTELRSLAFRMSHYNGYNTGTGPEILYGVTGATDDHVYYSLGVASFTYELSPTSGSCSGFTPAYSCIDSSIWPDNREALLYSIRVAGSPYTTPQGPTTTSVNGSDSVEQGSPLTISATVDDDAFGSTGISRPSGQAIAAAEYYLDASPLQGGTAVAMSASDGSFNQSSEGVQASIGTSGLTIGQHTLFVRGRDADGFWGPVAAKSFSVTSQTNDPPVADGQSISLQQDTSVAITLAGSDPEGDPLSFAITSGPASGSLTGTAANLVYTPNAGYVGTDQFNFTVSDGTSTSAPATVSITVTAEPGAGLPFDDNFEAGSGAWTSLDGNALWTIVPAGGSQWFQGAAPNRSGSGAQVTGDSTWTDYSVEVDTVTTSIPRRADGPGVLVRVVDANNHYRLRFDNRRWIIERVQNGTVTRLARSSRTSLSTNTPYNLQVEVAGNSLALYVNGSLRVSATDSAFMAGRIGLGVYGTVSRFDNVGVSTLS